MAFMSAVFSGIPGDLIMRSAANIRGMECCPDSNSIFAACNSFWKDALISEASDTKTSYPFSLPRMAAPTPDSPAPSMINFCTFCVMLSQFEGNNCYNR